MSNGYSIFTRARMGLDIKVWLTMLVVAVICATVFGFKVFNKNHCAPFGILIKGFTTGKSNSYYVSETITLSPDKSNAREIVWDFGDGTTQIEGDSAKHSFLREGTYNITATAYGGCIASEIVTIAQLNTQQINTAPLMMLDPISGPDTPHTGESVKYYSAVKANSYEWTVVNSPNFSTQKDSLATYKFLIGGTQYIQLKLDNDPKKIYRKTINVLQKVNKGSYIIPVVPVYIPPSVKIPENTTTVNKEPANKEPANTNIPVTSTPAVKTPKIYFIPDQEFQSMLELVVQGKQDVQSFNQFLCSGTDATKLLANGKEWSTVTQFCQTIRGNKKIIIKSVSSKRDDKKCVTILYVEYKKKGLF